MTPTEVTTDDWYLFYVPIYYDSSSTATNVVLSTTLSMLYLEESTTCIYCDGSPIDYSGTIQSAFTSVSLNYPNLEFSGSMSDTDNTISFSSSAAASLTVSSTAIGLISSYSGSDYSSDTWDGDSYVDGCLGLAYDSANPEYNILY